MAHAIAIAHHHRQRNEAHGNDRGRHRSCDGAKHRANQDHGIGEATPQPAEQLAKSFKQVFRQPRTFQDGSHQGEEGNGEQQVSLQHIVQLVSQVPEKIWRDKAKLDADQPEEQPDRCKRKRSRIAVEHEKNQPGEHEWRHVVFDQVNHWTGFS